MQRSKIIAGIEIGTSKVVVLLGEIVEGRSLNIVGMGQGPSRGVVKGDIVNFREASECVHACILAAEKQAGVKIDGSFLALSGSHIEGFLSEASVNIANADGLVDREDVERVSTLAKGRELSENRLLIHQLRRPYVLDGRIVDQPLNLTGERLEASYWTVHGAADEIKDAIRVVNGFNIHVDDVMLSGLATGAVAANAEEKKNGVLVIDIGRGATSYAIYGRGCCLSAGCLPIGGDHVSNDLSIGLRIRLKQAESLKRRYGAARVATKDKTEKVWLNNDREIGDRPVTLWSIEKICELRMTEILEVVRKKLGALASPDRLPAGVILCGGGSKLRSTDACAEHVFGVDARLGDNRSMASGDLADSQYSAALGLLHYGLHYQSSDGREPTQSVGFFSKLKTLFQKV